MKLTVLLAEVAAMPWTQSHFTKDSTLLNLDSHEQSQYEWIFFVLSSGWNEPSNTQNLRLETRKSYILWKKLKCPCWRWNCKQMKIRCLSFIPETIWSTFEVYLLQIFQFFGSSRRGNGWHVSLPGSTESLNSQLSTRRAGSADCK